MVSISDILVYSLSGLGLDIILVVKITMWNCLDVIMNSDTDDNDGELLDFITDSIVDILPNTDRLCRLHHHFSVVKVEVLSIQVSYCC